MQAAWPCLAIVICTLTTGCASVPGPTDMDVVQTFSACPRPSESRWIGDRAVVAPDGLALVYQFGDGSVHSWKATKVAHRGRITLVSAAVEAGIFPRFVHCPKEGDDCDISDHTTDWTSYVTWDTATYRVATLDRPDRAIPGYLGAVLVPRHGPATDIVDGAGGFTQLELRSIESWTARPLATVPTRNGIFQNSETQFSRVSWSNAYELLLVACGSAFVYFEGDVAFLRAYDRKGKEQWSVRRRLPKPAKPAGLHAGFTSINARLVVFAGGRFAAVTGGIDSRTSFEVMDLQNGRTIATLTGYPLAASEDASRVLVRMDESHLALVDLRQIAK